MTIWIPIGLAGVLLLAAVVLLSRRHDRRASTPGAQPTGLPLTSRRAFLATLAGAAALTAVGGAAYYLSSSRGSEGGTGRVGGLAAFPSSGSDASSAASAGKATATATRRQPNVLLITVDTLRADKVGAYGYAMADTPNLDRLASEGTRFSRVLTQIPQTNPSHAALFTGLYPSTNGVLVHMVDKLKPGAQTIASVFSDAGYKTTGIYSWVSLDPQFCGFDRGFQSYNGYIVNRNGVFANSQLESLAAIYRQLKSALPIVSTSNIQLGDNYEETMDGRADVTTAAALAWLDGYKSTDPFMTWIHYYDPHYPYSPPAPYDHILGLKYSGTIDGSIETVHKIQQKQLTPTPDDIARLFELYQGEIAFADAQIGKLFDALRTRGLLDDTIVAITGDHGESFAEHGDWFHGWNLWQTETGVPLILRYPSRISAGRVNDTPVQLVDLLPTLADLARIRPKQSVQGVSLVPLLDGTDDGSQRAAFTELSTGPGVSLVTGNWTMIKDLSNGQEQLYNLLDDSAENSDLSKAEPTVAANLSARLGDLAKVAGVVK